MTKKITDIMNQESFLKSSKNEQKMTLGRKSRTLIERFNCCNDNLFKLELSYHYQFYKVFGTDDKLEAKTVGGKFKKYPSECIDSAVEIVIQSNDYSTLTEIIKACRDQWVQ